MRAQAAPAEHPAIAVREPSLHLPAGHLAPERAVDERLTRLVDQPLRRSGRGLEHLGDLAVRETTELPQDQRGALLHRQQGEITRDALEALADLGALLDVCGPVGHERAQG
jgi:hypothetical protein